MSTSFFSRPDSPPPRSPSPEPVLTPLPPPRRRTPPRPTRLSLQGPQPRPKIPLSQAVVDKPPSRLASMRSCGELRLTGRSAHGGRAIVSAPPTPRSPAPPSPSESSFLRAHKRTLSFAVPYRSPPASPTIASPPPPVPPIPAFVLSPTDKKAVIHPVSPAPTRVNHIYLPDWEQFTVARDGAMPPRRSRRTSGGVTIVSARRAVAAPAPMTCSTFFALHNAPNGQALAPVAAL